MLSDGSALVMGGKTYDYSNYFRNDVWKTVNGGATWVRVTSSAGWTGKATHLMCLFHSIG